MRHIERTKMMIHVVDAAGIEGRDPVEDIYKINAELEAYNKEISMRPQVIAANKVDLIYSEDEDPIQRLRDEFEPKGIKVFPISGVTGEGLSDLLYYVNNELQNWMTSRSYLNRNISRKKRLSTWIFHIPWKKKTIYL